jgi:predicted RNase H-like nuclease (RuvC/YqgF family)
MSGGSSSPRCSRDGSTRDDGVVRLHNHGSDCQGGPVPRTTIRTTPSSRTRHGRLPGRLAAHGFDPGSPAGIGIVVHDGRVTLSLPGIDDDTVITRLVTR